MEIVIFGYSTSFTHSISGRSCPGRTLFVTFENHSLDTHTQKQLSRSLNYVHKSIPIGYTITACFNIQGETTVTYLLELNYRRKWTGNTKNWELKITDRKGDFFINKMSTIATIDSFSRCGAFDMAYYLNPHKGTWNTMTKVSEYFSKCSTVQVPGQSSATSSEDHRKLFYIVPTSFMLNCFIFLLNCLI